MKAIVLCGGVPQIALLNELRNRGIETVLLDMNEKVKAREYADKFYPVSVLDVEAVKAVAVSERADFIITVCAEQVLLVVAQLSEELGLPCYIDYQTAKNVSDKHGYGKEYNVANRTACCHIQCSISIFFHVFPRDLQIVLWQAIRCR